MLHTFSDRYFFNNRFVTVVRVHGMWRWSVFSTTGEFRRRCVDRRIFHGYRLTREGAHRAARRQAKERAPWEPYRRQHHPSTLQ